MASDIAIQIHSLSKAYRIWTDPKARLSAPIAREIGNLPGIPAPIRNRLNRYYNDCCHSFFALKGITQEIRKGETIGIIGRNGSGKSTLLQIIAGTLSPTTGSVAVNGSVAALLELASGFNPEFTGRENVFLTATVQGLSHREIEARFDEIAAFADIGEFLEQPVKTYSSGMMIRLAFAVRTAVNPDILIVDEALSVGDETFQRKCFARLAEIRERGTTVIFCSHSMGSVVNLCSRALFLHKGELILEGTPKFVTSRYQRFCHAPAHLEAELIHGFRSEKELLSAPEKQSSTENNPAHPEISMNFDPGLISQSRVVYDMQGGEIVEYGVFDQSGKAVNLLKNREYYRFRYKVRFDKTCTGVSFAMLIKNKEGQELGGGRSFPEGSYLEEVSANSIYEVNFLFQCLLTANTYFFNCGVEGFVEGKRAYVHRILDATVVRVLPEKNLLATAQFDFLIEPSYRQIDA
jgi:lipopolysaccharide transport system ATP-binding protein